LRAGTHREGQESCLRYQTSVACSPGSGCVALSPAGVSSSTS
jgi:hypothetical protein